MGFEQIKGRDSMLSVAAIPDVFLVHPSIILSMCLLSFSDSCPMGKIHNSQSTLCTEILHTLEGMQSHGYGFMYVFLVLAAHHSKASKFMSYPVIRVSKTHAKITYKSIMKAV
jgi:hypothetical protein